MDGEFGQYGFNEWFFETLEMVLDNNSVPALVAEMREPLVRHADEFIENSTFFAESGVVTYGQFLELWGNDTFVSFEHDRIRWRLWFTLLGPESDFAERKIGIVDEIYHSYNYSPTRAILDIFPTIS